jgi:hypothetical protein
VEKEKDEPSGVFPRPKTVAILPLDFSEEAHRSFVRLKESAGIYSDMEMVSEALRILEAALAARKIFIISRDRPHEMREVVLDFGSFRLPLPRR